MNAKHFSWRQQILFVLNQNILVSQDQAIFSSLRQGGSTYIWWSISEKVILTIIQFYLLSESELNPVHTTPEWLENATIIVDIVQPRSQGPLLPVPRAVRWETLGTRLDIVHFGFVFEENSVGEVTWPSWRHRFEKSFVFKMFTLRFEERFWKAPFS